MKTVSTHIAKLPLLLMLFIAFLSSSVAVHYTEDAAVATVQVEKKSCEKAPASDLVIKQTSFEAVIPFVSSFIPQNFYNFLVTKPVLVLDEVSASPQIMLSIPVYLRNVFSNIIATNAP